MSNNPKVFFDEVGLPNKRISDFAYELGETVRMFFFNIGEEGCPVNEIRAIESTLCTEIHVAAVNELYILQERIRQEKIRNADPNVSEEEKELLKSNFIAAVRHYRERTGRGLKESKDIMDKYIEKNNLSKVIPNY